MENMFAAHGQAFFRVQAVFANHIQMAYPYSTCIRGNRFLQQHQTELKAIPLPAAEQQNGKPTPNQQWTKWMVECLWLLPAVSQDESYLKEEQSKEALQEQQRYCLIPIKNQFFFPKIYSEKWKTKKTHLFSCLTIVHLHSAGNKILTKYDAKNEWWQLVLKDKVVVTSRPRNWTFPSLTLVRRCCKFCPIPLSGTLSYS